MPLSDFWIVVRWWGTLFLVGAAAYPLTKRLFQGIASGSGLRRLQGQTLSKQSQTPFLGWWDEGYLFSKAVGMAVVSWIVYVLGMLKILPFTIPTIILSLILLFAGGVFLQVIRDKRYVISEKSNFRILHLASHISLFFIEELFFFAALLFWTWVKAHEPSIRGLEKFMDYGFMQSILNSRYFPPPDMWYAGEPINYYYFGHLVTALLTKLSGIDLAYTFNLMLATIFALCFTMSFSLGRELFRHVGRVTAIAGGLLTAFLVTLAGNMQTMYAFTKGYTGDNVQPFWSLAWQIQDFWQKLPEGLERYWYANASRFIPFTIHEFPSYSFVVSDVHGHVLSIPFTLLAIALLVQMVIRDMQIRDKQNEFNVSRLTSHVSFLFYGFLVGVLLMTNALDGPIYLGLFIAILGISHLGRAVGYSFPLSHWKEYGKTLAIVLLAAIATSMPFLNHFNSFVNGLAVNCPPVFLQNLKIGPLIFETVDKCQRSPLWMLVLLWGFFIYCGLWLIFVKSKEIDRSNAPIERVLKVFFLFSLALIIFPEFFYFKDIYPAHFRSNTMFKLGYQAFILFSIVSAYMIVKVIRDTKEVTRKRIFLFFLLPQLFLVSIYPVFSVRSYFNSLRNYQGIYGLSWLEREYPDDYAAIMWLGKAIRDMQIRDKQNEFNVSRLTSHVSRSVLVEADGDSYTDYARFSAFTGIPTVVGWAVHEWLWRGSYDVVSPRREVVRLLYESEDVELTRQLFDQYAVDFVIVGSLERQKYTALHEEKLSILGQEVFRSGETVIYRMNGY